MRPNRRSVGVWWLLRKADGPGKAWQWSIERGLPAALREARELNALGPGVRAWIAETASKDPKGGTL